MGLERLRDHLNWNSVLLNGSIPPDVLEEMIADSHILVGRRRPG